VPSPVDANTAVYFLLHIPRTAGQTIQYHLTEHCAPGTIWVPRRSPFPVSLTGHRHRLDGLGDAAPVRVVAGHDVGRSLESRFPGREIRRAVLLRDPLSLQLSLYNYRMMNHLNRGLGTYSFDLHLRALPRDWVAHRLLARWLEIPWPRLMTMSGAEKYRVLNEMLAGFWFVGSHADCDRLIAAVAPDVGAPPVARARNTAQQWQKQIYWERWGCRRRSGTPCCRATRSTRRSGRVGGRPGSILRRCPPVHSRPERATVLSRMRRCVRLF
jgi:hypothetical protein